MVIFPNCKINLGLRILRKRADGFHDLETVFYPLQITDVLEIVTGHDLSNDQSVHFGQTGERIEGAPASNLCIKAYELLKKEFPSLPSARIHLHKNIPMGAGLGGGSADAAFALKLLNEKFHLQLTTEQLIDRALQLGSDCPFFIVNKPCYATGRGEFLQSISLDLTPYTFVVVHPGIHIPTAWAFSLVQPGVDGPPLTDVLAQPVEKWNELLKNDFETPVFAKYPEIEQLRESLYKQGAVYASLTGSGSSVYGLFEKNKVPAETTFPPHYRVDMVN